MEILKRNILLTGSVNEEMLFKIGEKILKYNSEDAKNENVFQNYIREPINIYVNTNGGYVDDGFSIIDIIGMSTTPIVTICLGKAYSMGLLILLAGHIRYASANACSMMHDVSTGVAGTAQEIFEYTDIVKGIQDKAFNYIKERCKIPSKLYIEAKVNKKDIYFNLDDMLKYKIVEFKLDNIL
jgi:ATP-dependent Clp protease protease subunit